MPDGEREREREREKGSEFYQPLDQIFFMSIF